MNFINVGRNVDLVEYNSKQNPVYCKHSVAMRYNLTPIIEFKLFDTLHLLGLLIIFLLQYRERHF